MQKFRFFAFAIPAAMSLLLGCDPESVRPFDLQGHRGARAVLPENSVPGFVFANALGVTTLELDVVVTAAGEVVVSHEPWFNSDVCRSPSGADLGGRSFFDWALADIQACDCGSWGHPRFPRQAAVPAFKPTLDQVVAAVAAGFRQASLPPVRFNIEIKHDAEEVGRHFPSAEVAVERVVEAITRLGIAPRTTVQSFSADVLERVHAASAGVETAWLMEDEVRVGEALGRLSFRPDVYSPHHVLLSREEVVAAHAAGVRVVPWTVNEGERMAELVAWGVDGLITDDPEAALEVLAALRPGL